MVTQLNVLVVGSDRTEAEILEQILGGHVVLHSVRDLLDLQVALRTGSFDVAFCAWSFPGGNWSDALEKIQHRNPDLPVIVMCRTGGDREWLDVLAAGGFDILVGPYLKPAVLAVLEQAIASGEGRRMHPSVAMPKAG